MIPGSEDSHEVIQFMALFSELKERTDDDPHRADMLAKRDKALSSLCVDLSRTANKLTETQRRRRSLLAAPVNPSFIEAWRDFEKRYKHVLSIYPLIELLFGDDWDWDHHSTVETTGKTRIRSEWKEADASAFVQANAIESAIEFAYQQGTDEGRFDEDFRETIEEGVAAWDRLKNDAEFDLHGVFRRRALVPFVLVPGHVAAKHSHEEPLSLYEYLRQAHEALVFGAPYAALALMRSIMESVLRDHYAAFCLSDPDPLSSGAERSFGYGTSFAEGS